MVSVDVLGSKLKRRVQSCRHPNCYSRLLRPDGGEITRLGYRTLQYCELANLPMSSICHIYVQITRLHTNWPIYVQSQPQRKQVQIKNAEGVEIELKTVEDVMNEI